jgi:hypothetical protein
MFSAANVRAVCVVFLVLCEIFGSGFAGVIGLLQAG